MGQGASTDTASAASEDGTAPASGVSLSPELVEEIQQEFLQQNIQQEWNTYRTNFLSKRNDALRKIQQETNERHEAYRVREQQYRSKLNELEQSIDAQKAKFDDMAVAMEYDADAVSNKVLGGDSATRPRPCLGPRAHWLDCAHKYATDTRPCDGYMDILEKCVKEAIIVKETGSGSA